MRLKQFIMDNYEFNLDLETWGLTTKEKEIERFKDFIPPDEISKSNALFGYEGDKYYFDVDIRKHFGLDKYTANIIPYWKTETVEAMNAFRRKSGYNTGAGECVSLSSLYAAAAFIVCGIPLEDIYMVLTPLHSQNFIDIQDGVLTNNRRLVTKTMWFNGTAISNKAQRALRNEQVTIVAHNTGFVHCLYKDATIDKNAYGHLIERLSDFVSTELTSSTLPNFLRSNTQYQKYFQFCCEHCRSGPRFAKAEVLFDYEHNSRYNVSDETSEKLIEEVSEEDTLSYKITDRICCQEFFETVKRENADIRQESGRNVIKKYLTPYVPDIDKFLTELADFMHVTPKLPEADKNYIPGNPINISPDWSREQIIAYLQEIRNRNITADMAFYAYRDMESCDWKPFVKAAIERSPVSVEQTKLMSIDEIYSLLINMNEESIYGNKRLAQPDELANYKTGDGLEKAFFLANIIRHRNPSTKLKITVNNNEILLDSGRKYAFKSGKMLKKQIVITEDNSIDITDL